MEFKAHSKRQRRDHQQKCPSTLPSLWINSPKSYGPSSAEMHFLDGKGLSLQPLLPSSPQRQVMGACQRLGGRDKGHKGGGRCYLLLTAQERALGFSRQQGSAKGSTVTGAPELQAAARPPVVPSGPGEQRTILYFKKQGWGVKAAPYPQSSLLSAYQAKCPVHSRSPGVRPP